MSVYDLAHALAKALQEAEVYREYLAAKGKIRANPATEKMLKDYQTLYFKVHTANLLGQEIKAEEKEKLEKLEDIIKLNSMVQEFLSLENRLGVMLQDVQKITTGSLDLGFDEQDGEVK